MRVYCTYFDHRFLPRGLAMQESLIQFDPDSELWVLCLDQVCKSELERLNLQNVCLLTLEELETWNPALLATKTERTTLEYYFTCTPQLPAFVFDKRPKADWVTYLDADLMFFHSVEPIWEELKGFSVGIIGHRFPVHLQSYEILGKYNVGWVSFRYDAAGMQALHWWGQKCLEWCFNRVESGKYADQKYLDEMATMPGVRIIQQKGCNVAPWNIGGLRINLEDGVVLANADPLIFYHFHGLKHVSKYRFTLGFFIYGVKPSKRLLFHVYEPYLADLVKHARRLSEKVRESCQFSHLRVIEEGLQTDNAAKGRLEEIKRFLGTWFDVARRRQIIFKDDRILPLWVPQPGVEK